jgi:hypothetical protein
LAVSSDYGAGMNKGLYAVAIAIVIAAGLYARPHSKWQLVANPKDGTVWRENAYSGELWHCDYEPGLNQIPFVNCDRWKANPQDDPSLWPAYK